MCRPSSDRTVRDRVDHAVPTEERLMLTASWKRELPQLTVAGALACCAARVLALTGAASARDGVAVQARSHTGPVHSIAFDDGLQRPLDQAVPGSSIPGR